VYYCQDCGCEFVSPLRIFEKHSLEKPPFETFFVCPSCKGVNYEVKVYSHCRCCGAKLTEGQTEYCNATCKETGKKLWAAERKRRALNFSSPIAMIMREVEEYNRINGTKLSYGQYVAFVR